MIFPLLRANALSGECVCSPTPWQPSRLFLFFNPASLKEGINKGEGLVCLSLSKWVVIDSVKDEIGQTTNKQTATKPTRTKKERLFCKKEKGKKGRKKKNVERS